MGPLLLSRRAWLGAVVLVGCGFGKRADPTAGAGEPRRAELDSVRSSTSAANVATGDSGRQTMADQRETAILAGGCFWGMQDILRKVPGVLETEVGYTGGELPDPTYEDVKTGRTGHAEAIRVVFDPSQITYATLLEQWFFRMHDPTTKNRQGNDRGTQYRSAIFVLSDEQRHVAELVRRRVDESGRWSAPIVTEILPAGPFTPAEGYHQDYLEKHPGGYTCHYLRD